MWWRQRVRGSSRAVSAVPVSLVRACMRTWQWRAVAASGNHVRAACGIVPVRKKKM